MLRLLFTLLFLTSLQAKEIHPHHIFKAIGYVSDFIVTDNHLYAADDEGVVTVFDLRTKKIVDTIMLEPLTTQLGELQPARILSIDYFNGKILLVSIGKNLYRNVWIYEKHKLKKIISEDAKLTIKEARFLDNEKILIATFASEIMLYDMGEKYTHYKRHVTQSALGDITLTQDKKHVIMADESGEARIIDVANSKTLQVLSSENVDNVFHVAHAKGVTLTAGQDRRIGVYQKGRTPYHIKSDFLVYCVGITPSGKTGIYSSGEENKLQLFSIQTKQKLHKLSGHKAVINQIKFVNEKELYSSESSPYIYYWKLD
ncbi:MAG: nitrate reductase [Epsilonproteobacteria bacterium]|nr:nitrate reductase [Campylobacterota bacterium]